MDLIIRKKKTFNRENYLGSTSSYKKNSIGFWGYVSAVNSDSLTVDVVDDTGVEYKYIPVSSKEWVNADLSSGERNLPPVNTRVFVLMPTSTIQSAFILCSGFGRGQSDELSNFVCTSNDNTELEKYSNSKKIKSVDGWQKEIDNTSGNLKIISNDENIILDSKIKTESSNENPNLSINVYGHTIVIDKDGLSITTKDKTPFTINSYGHSISLTEDNIKIKAQNKTVAIECSNFTVNNTDLVVGS